MEKKYQNKLYIAHLTPARRRAHAYIWRQPADQNRHYDAHARAQAVQHGADGADKVRTQVHGIYESARCMQALCTDGHGEKEADQQGIAAAIRDGHLEDAIGEAGYRWTVEIHL